MVHDNGNSNERHQLPVITRRLRRLLRLVLFLIVLLIVNSAYLAGVTSLEGLTGQRYQDYFYLSMFLGHLAIGLLLVVPFVLFFALHLRGAV